MAKKIGIIGGLSPESTVTYYLHITRSYMKQFGDTAFPEIIIYSVSLEKYHSWRNLGSWDLIIQDLVQAGRSLEKAGADFALIATNTMHKVFHEVQESLSIPLISLIDAVASRIKETQYITKIGLIGTLFTMTDGFYSDNLHQNGLETIIPDEEEQKYIHNAIENELVKGLLPEKTKLRFLEIIKKLHSKGAQGVILGCTEIPLLINQSDTTIPLFDSAVIHAEAAYRAGIE